MLFPCRNTLLPELRTPLEHSLPSGAFLGRSGRIVKSINRFSSKALWRARRSLKNYLQQRQLSSAEQTNASSPRSAQDDVNGITIVWLAFREVLLEVWVRRLVR